jgi:hypothetical protein
MNIKAGACIINSDNKIVGIGNYTQEKLRKNDFLSIFKNNFNKSKTDYGKLNTINFKSEMLKRLSNKNRVTFPSGCRKKSDAKPDRFK